MTYERQAEVYDLLHASLGGRMSGQLTYRLPTTAEEGLDSQLVSGVDEPTA